MSNSRENMEKLKMDDSFTVKCIINSKECEAKITLYDEEKCGIRYEMENDNEYVEGDNYFYALIDLRKILESKGIKLLCKGCCRNVYPSPMILDMGDAMSAYQMTIGKPALLKDLVNIFEPCDINEYATIQEQIDYYKRWTDHLSLRDKKIYNYKQIKQFDKKGILFDDGTEIIFDDCRKNWSRENGLDYEQTVCVAERNIIAEVPYFLFYGDVKIKIEFTKSIFNRSKKLFMKFQKDLNRFGYSSYDCT